MTPYFERDGIVIYHGDCREILPGLAADVMVTDPPYGMVYESNMRGRWGYVSARTIAHPIEGDGDTAARDAVLASWGERPALVFGTWKQPRPEGTRQVLIWDKGAGVGMGDLSIPWKPNTEEVYVLGGGFVGHRGSSVLRFNAIPPNLVGRIHPTEKPIELMRDLVGKCPPGTVLDPFMGSGTTLRAAMDLGRRAIGIEIEERYCEIAARRLDQMVLPLGSLHAIAGKWVS